MANDAWNGAGNWTGNPTNWSLGSPPTSSETAEIQTGSVTLSSASTVAGLTIDPAASELYLGRGAALGVAGDLVDDSALDVATNSGDGTVAVSIGGALEGSGAVDIGNGSLTAPVTVTTASYGDTGALAVIGSGAPGSADLATLDILSAAPITLTANTSLAGDALLEYASGGVEAVAGDVTLSLFGGAARASIGAGTTSTALQGLLDNSGTVDLEGNENGSLGGANLSTAVGLTNVGKLFVDADSGAGGSDLAVGGALYNLGSAVFGSYYLRDPTEVSATTLVDNGSLTLAGAAAEDTADIVTLDISSAAPLATTGNLTLSGGAEIDFGSGNLEYVAPGDTLYLGGAQAQLDSGGYGDNSALVGFVQNEGTFELEGDYDGETGGGSLTTLQALVNTGAFDVDHLNAAGGSQVEIGGALDNYGAVTIGDSGLVASTTVTATALANGGNLTIQGSNEYESVDQATLDITGANYTTVTGNIALIGDALLELPHIPPSDLKAGVKPATSGNDPGITAIGFGGSLTLEGSEARVSLGYGPANTGLEQLSLNDGVLDLEGDYGNGPGGSTVYTEVGLTNVGSLDVDVGSGAGGSDLAIDGALINAGDLGAAALVDIGNPSLGAPTTVSATSLSTSGNIVLVGQSELDAANEATLAVAGGAPSAVSGFWYVSGDALMQFASGSVKAVDPESSLELDGAQAQISDSGGAFDSAISGLSASYGNLTFAGDAYNGAGGADIALTSGLVSTGNLSIDAGANQGGTTLTVTGALLSSGVTAIGNTTLTANTQVTVGSLTNDFALYLAGNASGGGERATLDVTGAAGLGATGAIVGYVQLTGDSLLEFGSGGITTIAPDSTLALLTGQSPGGGFVAVAGNLTSNSALAGLSVNYGVLGLAFGATIATTAGTSFTNDGTVEIDGIAGSDGGSALDVGGTLINSGSFDLGGDTTETAASTVTAAALDNYGDLELLGDLAASVTVTVSGSATNDGTVGIGTDSSLDAGTHVYYQYAGATTVAGAINASAIDDEGGLIDFTTALTGSGGLDIYGGAAMEFGAAASRAVTFKTTTGALELGAPGSFTGTIAGFAGEDVIDLLGATVTGLSYSAGRLTVSGSGGTIASLAFSGSYTNSSFTYVSDGQGGTDVILTPAVEWDGADASWSSANWSSTPNSTDDAVLAGTVGYAVNVGSAIDVNALVITDPQAILTFYAPSTTSLVGANVVNNGQISIDDAGEEGGTTVDISGALDNERGIYIGDNDLDAATTVEAASLLNSGTIFLEGNSDLTPSYLATLDIGGAAPSVLTGALHVEGDALVEFASGSIATIAEGAYLQIVGANARISDGAGTTNSALSGLTMIAGDLDLEGGSYFGAGAPSVATNAGLTVTGTVDLDESGGGSSLSVGGALTVSGNVTVGNSGLAGNSTLTATSLVDDGTVTLWGSEAASPTYQATLEATGAGQADLFGSLYLHGDALVEFASGGITTIEHGAELQLDGAYSRISDGAGLTNSGLGNLATIAGTFDEEGDWSTGPGGADVSTSKSVTVTGNLDLDTYSQDGASTFHTAGALTDRGAVIVGNPSQSGNTTLSANALGLDGALTLWGSGVASPIYQTTVEFAGAAPGTVTGHVLVYGNALLEFGSGAITAIAAGSELELDGKDARVSIGPSSTNSALGNLASIAGTFDMEGDATLGGSSATTDVAMTNSGSLDLDTGYDAGGSSLTVGGTLTNSGQIEIGIASLDGNTSLSASALVNRGSITLQGESAAGATEKAALAIGAAASGAIDGDIIVRGDAALEYASGSFTSIAAGSLLELDGAQAIVTDGAGATNAALGNLATVAGELLLHGDSSYGAGGGNLSTAALTVTGQLLVDPSGGDGGTHVSIAGSLTNEGQVTLGDTLASAQTVLAATSITNRGAFDMYGAAGEVTEANVSGAFDNYDNVSIGANASLDATGSYLQYAGTTTVDGALEAATVVDRGGLIDFQTALAGTSTGALDIYGAGALEFDSSVATGNTVAFKASTGDLKLLDAAAFAATISGFTGNDVIDLVDLTATSVAFAAGVLKVYDGSTEVAALKMSGSYTTASFLLASDGNGGADILDPSHGSATHAAAAQLTQAMATFGAGAEAPLQASIAPVGLEAPHLLTASARLG